MASSFNRREFLIIAATIIASGMAFLDGSVVNIAIPAIQKELHASFASVLWVVNAFALALACLLLTSGGLSDRFGRRRVFAWGIGVFTVASLLCGIAGSATALVLFRALQGLGAAMMIPGSLALIHVNIEEGRRGKAIGLWSGLSGGIAALGPFVGGWLVEHFSWRAVFFINLPLGIIALALTLFAIPESKNEQATGKFDLLGSALIIVGLFGLSYGLMEVPNAGWASPKVIASLIIGAGAIAAFFIVEKRSRSPLVPLQIFKSPLVKGANLATLTLYFALSGVIFFLTLNMQQIQGLTPVMAGLALLPSIVIITFLSGFGGSLADRIGPRKPMLFGSLIVALSMASLILPGTAANYFIAFFPGMVLFGFGMALVIAPLTKSALAVPARFSGAASGINNAVSRVAALLALAVLGAIAVPVFASALKNKINAAPLASDQRQVILQQSAKFGAIEVPSTFDPASAAVAKTAIKESLVYSFRVVMVINTLLALASAFATAKYIKKESDSKAQA